VDNAWAPGPWFPMSSPPEDAEDEMEESCNGRRGCLESSLTFSVDGRLRFLIAVALSPAVSVLTAAIA
jgi:hypothetical protein